MADHNGGKVGPETKLHPAPTRVEYPNSEHGETVDTADGRVVVQVSNRDPRRRSWIWSNFGPELSIYERQHRWLESLVSRRRMSLGLPPCVYVCDNISGLLNYARAHTTTVGQVNGALLTIPALPANVNPAYLTNAVVEVLPAAGGTTAPYERRSVLAATATSLQLDDPFSATLRTSPVMITWTEPVWWKVRVLDPTRELRGDGGSVRYSNSRFLFVIDEEVS
jgi:hypothetical protein